MALASGLVVTRSGRQSVMGSWVHLGLLYRASLSVWQAVYTYINTGPLVGSPWSSVRHELVIVAALLLFLSYPVGLRPVSTVVAQDASGPNEMVAAHPDRRVIVLTHAYLCLEALLRHLRKLPTPFRPLVSPHKL